MFKIEEKIQEVVIDKEIRNIEKESKKILKICYLTKFHKEFSEFMESLKEGIRHSCIMWRELLKKSPTRNLVEKQSRDLIKTNDRILEKYDELEAQEFTSIRVKKIFSLYLRNVAFDSETADKIYEEFKADDREKKLAPEEDFLENIKDKKLDTCLVFVSANPEKFNEISKVFGKSKKFFGYQRCELEGESVNILMIDHYQHNHDRVMKGYFEDEKSDAMGQIRMVVCRLKNGYVATFHIQIGLLPDLKDGIQYVGIFSKIDLDDTELKDLNDEYDDIEEDEEKNFFVVETLEKKILGVSKNFFDEFGIDYRLFEPPGFGIRVCDVLPQLENFFEKIEVQGKSLKIIKTKLDLSVVNDKLFQLSKDLDIDNDEDLSFSHEMTDKSEIKVEGECSLTEIGNYQWLRDTQKIYIVWFKKINLRLSKNKTKQSTKIDDDGSSKKMKSFKKILPFQRKSTTFSKKTQNYYQFENLTKRAKREFATDQWPPFIKKFIKVSVCFWLTVTTLFTIDRMIKIFDMNVLKENTKKAKFFNFRNLAISRIGHYNMKAYFLSKNLIDGDYQELQTTLTNLDNLYIELELIQQIISTPTMKMQETDKNFSYPFTFKNPETKTSVTIIEPYDKAVFRLLGFLSQLKGNLKSQNSLIPYNSTNKDLFWKIKSTTSGSLRIGAEEIFLKYIDYKNHLIDSFTSKEDDVGVWILISTFVFFFILLFMIHKAFSQKIDEMMVLSLISLSNIEIILEKISVFKQNYLTDFFPEIEDNYDFKFGCEWQKDRDDSDLDMYIDEKVKIGCFDLEISNDEKKKNVYFGKKGKGILSDHNKRIFSLKGESTPKELVRSQNKVISENLDKNGKFSRRNMNGGSTRKTSESKKFISDGKSKNDLEEMEQRFYRFELLRDKRNHVLKMIFTQMTPLMAEFMFFCIIALMVDLKTRKDIYDGYLHCKDLSSSASNVQNAYARIYNFYGLDEKEIKQEEIYFQQYIKESYKYLNKLNQFKGFGIVDPIFESYINKFKNIYSVNLCKYSTEEELKIPDCNLQILNKGLGTASVFVLEESRKILQKWEIARKSNDKDSSLVSILTQDQSKILVESYKSLILNYSKKIADYTGNILSSYIIIQILAIFEFLFTYFWFFSFAIIGIRRRYELSRKLLRIIPIEVVSQNVLIQRAYIGGKICKDDFKRGLK